MKISAFSWILQKLVVRPTKSLKSREIANTLPPPNLPQQGNILHVYLLTWSRSHQTAQLIKNNPFKW